MFLDPEVKFPDTIQDLKMSLRRSRKESLHISLETLDYFEITIL